MKPKEKVRIEEFDFLLGEEVEIPSDVYNLTIAANMSKDCTPYELCFCIKQCVIVFFIQIMIAIFWTFDFQNEDYYQY